MRSPGLTVAVGLSLFVGIGGRPAIAETGAATLAVRVVVVRSCSIDAPRRDQSVTGSTLLVNCPPTVVRTARIEVNHAPAALPPAFASVAEQSGRVVTVEF